MDNSNTRVKDIAIILTRDNRFGTKRRDLVNGAAYGKCRKIDSAFDVLDTAPGPHQRVTIVLASNVLGQHVICLALDTACEASASAMSETFKFFNENFRDTNAVVSHTRLRNKALEAAEGRKVTVARDSTGICVTVDPAATAYLPDSASDLNN